MSSLKIKFNKEFIYPSNPIEYEGKLYKENDKIILKYTYNNYEYEYYVFLDNNKLCINKINCENYFNKNTDTELILGNKRIYKL